MIGKKNLMNIFDPLFLQLITENKSTGSVSNSQFRRISLNRYVSPFQCSFSKVPGWFITILREGGISLPS